MAEKNGVWKTVSTHLGTIIMTGLIAWFSFGGGIEQSEAKRIAEHAAADAVDSIPSIASRTDISKMIQTESPYVTDKSAIEVRLKNIESVVQRIEKKLDQ